MTLDVCEVMTVKFEKIFCMRSFKQVYPAQKSILFQKFKTLSINQLNVFKIAFITLYFQVNYQDDFKANVWEFQLSIYI